MRGTVSVVEALIFVLFNCALKDCGHRVKGWFAKRHMQSHPQGTKGVGGPRLTRITSVGHLQTRTDCIPRKLKLIPTTMIAEARADARQNSPIHGKPPIAKTSPAADAPAITPIWLLVTSNPFAVARASPANSAVTTQLIGSKIVSTTMPRQLSAIAHQGTMSMPNARLRPTPPAMSPHAAHVRRCGEAAKYPPSILPVIVPNPTKAKGRAVCPCFMP